MTMKKPRRLTHTAIALYINAALLLAILLAMASRGNGIPEILPVAAAQTQLPIAGGAGFFIMPAQFSQNVWGCYLLDVDSQTLCAYQYLEGRKQLRLVAARNFQYDRRLSNFNTGSPSPLEVRALVEKEQLNPGSDSGELAPTTEPITD